MKKRVWVTCGIGLGICLWLLLHGKTEKTVRVESQPTSVAATNQTIMITPKPVPPAQASVVSVPTIVAANNLATNSAYPINPDLEAILQKPINFYGKVVDENTNPVSGASVSFRWDDFTAKDWTRTSAASSDSDGQFSLLGKRGSTLIVSVSKAGYYTPRSGQGSFQYASGNPNLSADPQNPVVFSLRKKGIGERLITTIFPGGIGQIAQLHHDGTPVELDLLNGAKAPGGAGQLKLEFWRPVSARRAKTFDWRFQLSAPGGGLVGTDEEFAFQAPQIAYASSIVIDMPATNQNWQAELHNKYYIQLATGEYGRIEVYLLPYNGVFSVKSTINPSGSRNLEPAP